jgi:hypothetical protein
MVWEAKSIELWIKDERGLPVVALHLHSPVLLHWIWQGSPAWS